MLVTVSRPEGDADLAVARRRGEPKAGWDAGIRSHFERAENEDAGETEASSDVTEDGRAATSEAKWLGVRDDFRNWVIRAA
jgi:hypothetical protein